MKGQLGVGVIGVGAFGSRHAEVYRQLDVSELVAVADVNPQRLNEICPVLQVEGYSDYRELLKREDICAVSICTTDELHVKAAIAAAHAGKHVFVEKPLALTSQDCDTIIDACASSGVKLTVGHILRFDPRYFAAYREIREERIGKLVHVFARRNNPVLEAHVGAVLPGYSRPGLYELVRRHQSGEGIRRGDVQKAGRHARYRAGADQVPWWDHRITGGVVDTSRVVSGKARRQV